MAEAKGEGKDDYDDAKGSGGGGGGGGGGRNRRLLMDVAAEADMSLFGGSSELMIWVGEHCDEWADAVAGEEDGSGSPIKQMGRWKSLHTEYLAIMESWLTHIVTDQGGTVETFMDEVKDALESGATTTFPLQKHHDFLKTVMAMDDFEEFHGLMMKWSKLQSMSPMPRGHK